MSVYEVRIRFAVWLRLVEYMTFDLNCHIIMSVEEFTVYLWKVVSALITAGSSWATLEASKTNHFIIRETEERVKN